MARTTSVKGNGRAATRPTRVAPAALRSPALIERVVRYFRDVRAEMLKVHWPSRAELIASTSVVVVVLVLSSLYLGGWDAFFTWLVQQAMR